MTGIILAVVSSLGWVALDSLRKMLGENIPAFIAAGAIAAAQLPFLLLGFGLGFGTRLLETPAEYFYWAAPTVLLNLAAGFLFVRALQLSPLGLTIPYLAFTPVFNAVVGALFLQQVPTPFGWLGIAIVVFGALFLNPAADGAFNPIKGLVEERGSLYMLVVALIWSITPSLDKTAVDLTSPFLHTCGIAVGIGLGTFLIVSIRSKSVTHFFRKTRSMWGILLLSGFANVVALGCQLWAYEFVDVAYVETVKRAIGVIGAIAVGAIFYSEKFRTSVYFGIVLMVTGVVMVILTA